jgi:hypothetical protein
MFKRDRYSTDGARLLRRQWHRDGREVVAMCASAADALEIARTLEAVGDAAAPLVEAAEQRLADVQREHERQVQALTRRIDQVERADMERAAALEDILASGPLPVRRCPADESHGGHRWRRGVRTSGMAWCRGTAEQTEVTGE